MNTKQPTVRNIGVLTSGGDAPGMNAAIRGIVRGGMQRGFHVYGIRRGFHGLWRGDIEQLNGRLVSEQLQRGGTFLMTARSATFNTPEGVRKAIEMAKVFDLDAVVVIGGDGTLRGARDLAEQGLPVIGVPATIDNDVSCSDYSIGYDTALNTATEAIDKLRDTAMSHERCSVIEVMGRRAGYLALNVGIACGAEIIMVPEVATNFEQDVIKVILEGRNSGKHHYIVIVAEGAASAYEIASKIEQVAGIEAQATILGHLQRGGSPSNRDRVMASIMALKAIDCLLKGRLNRVVAYKQGQVIDLDIKEALTHKKTIDQDSIAQARVLSVRRDFF